MERNHSDNIRCIEKGQPEYPEKLKAYDHMPEKLYIKGRLPDPERPCAAVVGARMCSPYGEFSFALLLLTTRAGRTPHCLYEFSLFPKSTL